MNTHANVAVPLVSPSFSRVFAALGAGVASVTLVLWLVGGNPMLDVILSGLVVLLFVGVVMREVGRLLADEGPDD